MLGATFIIAVSVSVCLSQKKKFLPVTHYCSHTQIDYVTGQHGYTTFAKYCRVAQASKLEYTIESLQHPILFALIGGRLLASVFRFH